MYCVLLFFRLSVVMISYHMVSWLGEGCVHHIHRKCLHDDCDKRSGGNGGGPIGHRVCVFW